MCLVRTGTHCISIKFALIALFFITSFSQADIYFSSRTIGPSTNIYSVNTEGVIKKITDNNAWQDAQADFSDNGDIVFMSNRKDKVKVNLNKQSEDFNIFTLEAKSGVIKQISFSPEFEHSPAISSDGQWITYLKKTGNFRELMLLKKGETTPKTLVIADNIPGYSWSPNSQTLSFVSLSDNKSRLYLYDIKTGEKTLLLEVSSVANSEAKPDNKTFNGQFSSLLTEEDHKKGRIISSSQWSPDGKKIAYVLAAVTEQQRKLQVLNLWSKSIIQSSTLDVQVQQPVSWSPNSKSISYAGLIDYNFYFDEKTQKKVYEGSMQIYLSDLQGNIQKITEGQHLHNRPVFSPDGTQIAYLYGKSLELRTLALHTIDLQGKQQREYYDRVAGDSYLYWR